MSKSQRLNSILDKVKGKEKKYDWIGAAELCAQALRVVVKTDFLKRGDIQEKIGRCFHRAAFQAESQEEFKQRMRLAIDAYEKAHGFHEKLTDEHKAARMLRCKAYIKYFGYWLMYDPSEKRKLLDECLELEGRALAGFLESGDTLEYGKTYNELQLVFHRRGELEWNRQTLKGIVERGQKWGENAVTVLTEHGNLYEIARAYFTLATCLRMLRFYFIAEPEEKERNLSEAIKYLSKAVDLSKEVGEANILGLLHYRWGTETHGDEAIEHFEKTFEYGKRTRDNLLIAVSLDHLAYETYWKALTKEDPEKRRELAEKAMQFYEKGQHHYSIMALMSSRDGFIGPPAGHAENYWELATYETDPEKRLEQLIESEKAGMEALRLAEDSDMPRAKLSVYHVLSKTLEFRARIESATREKRSRLEKALKYRERTIEIQEQLEPFYYWNLGVMYNYLADIKAELADIQPSLNIKKRLSEEAVSSKEKCLKLIAKTMPYYEKKGDLSLFAALYGYQDTYGILLSRLYELTSNPEYLKKAIEISMKAIESANKLDMVSFMAESHWKIAKVQDILGEHLAAAENFKLSSENYLKAADKIPQLEDFYRNHASYMEAWTAIENARYHHREKHYGQAKEHYEKAANLHKSTERWNYLSLNYLAWARLEAAEDLSRREQPEEARDLFQQAANLFVTAKKSVKAKQETLEASDEKEMAARLVKASQIRREYCLGRIALEEAIILDKQGDHAASSRKYESAAEIFQKIAETESEQNRKELQPIIYLCQAWQKMMMAEAKASSTMYGVAAELFKQAKEHAFDQPTSLLSLAHSSFCKALEAGTEFEITRDMTMYSTVKKHLEAAASYYLRAGFKNASEYARGTHRLFDAYMYMHKAETETEPKRKTQYYQMAERLLQSSAGSYMKAKHPEKSEEVKTLLESVKEERQLAMSLAEVLHAPTITSTTTSFSTPTPSHEQAVGLERFEHADIQANLILRVTEVRVGEDVEFRVELVNAGKAPALLIKVDEIVPEGFEIKQMPEIYAVEDSYINLKGKRLNPLKTEDVKMVVSPRSKGTFIVKPRVLYIDETGKYRSHEPEPATITVKELGIRSWIKGER